MLLWTFSILCLLLGAGLLLSELKQALFSRGVRREISDLIRVTQLLQELQESLESGLVPSLERWEALKALPEPWGKLSFDGVQRLRSQGGALVPTLRRLRSFAEEHLKDLRDAQAKSAQALAQAWVCLALVPLFGGVLMGLLPGLLDRPWVWGGVCLLAASICSMGAFWLLGMAEEARWGGIERAHRSWILSSQCSGERFLALIRAGLPPDLAWGGACEGFSAWGMSVWKTLSDATVPPEKAPSQGAEAGAGLRKRLPHRRHVSPRGKSAMAQTILSAGDSIKKAVQLSLMEGRPCIERVESILQGLRHEMRAQVERELTLLPTRALKPLFIFVAPPLLGLLVAGFALSWDGMS